MKINNMRKFIVKKLISKNGYYKRERLLKILESSAIKYFWKVNVYRLTAKFLKLCERQNTKQITDGQKVWQKLSKLKKGK
jgi:hypothetical protein